MESAFSDFIFYADESGDHSLAPIDPTYPIFALTLCAFNKRSYARQIVPRFQDLKFRYFGHDSIILHEREIRKQTGCFDILTDLNVREEFMLSLNSLMEISRFDIIASVIDKREIKHDLFPDHPYHISLKLCLELAYYFLSNRNQEKMISHFIFEKRGQKEDKELELEFRRITQGHNDIRIPFHGFKIVFADKKANSTGMQIADLIARPIGLHILRPAQENKAFEIIYKKIFHRKLYAFPRKGIFTFPKKRKAPDHSGA